jgi:hypothetical protein
MIGAEEVVWSFGFGVVVGVLIGAEGRHYFE